MNNKGFTLLEVIISITILSIASLMLFSGFSAILNFMEKSNSVKNASNALLSYAEGDLKENIKKKVKINSSPVKYIIKSDLVKDIEVNTRKGILTPSDGTDIMLKNMSNSYLRLLNSYEEYKAVNGYATEMIEVCNKYLESDFFDGISYNGIIKQILDDKQKWDRFADNLLVQNFENQSFILPIFPFESKNSDGSIANGALLIYLSRYENKNVFGDGFQESLHYFYYYDKKSKHGDWYFTDSNRYQIRYSNKTGCVELVANTSGGEQRFTSYEVFISHVKGAFKEDWKMLNGDAEFNGTDSLNIWL